MHNLVKEHTGINFADFGDDAEAAKEAAIKALGIGSEGKDSLFIQTCPSVGHVLNEVRRQNISNISSFFTVPYSWIAYLACSFSRLLEKFYKYHHGSPSRNILEKLSRCEVWKGVSSLYKMECHFVVVANWLIFLRNDAQPF